MGMMEPNRLVAQLTAGDRALIRIVQHGLPLVSRPYADIAERLATTEPDVIERLTKLINNGAIKRYGIVVRHHELGYRANGMVVWDIPDQRVRELGRCIGGFDCVTLSYRRPRRLPDWPYNLFTMVHGRDRTEVEGKVADIVERCGLQDINHSILFSIRRFKQRGARYTSPESAGTPAASLTLSPATQATT